MEASLWPFCQIQTLATYLDVPVFWALGENKGFTRFSCEDCAPDNQIIEGEKFWTGISPILKSQINTGTEQQWLFITQKNQVIDDYVPFGEQIHHCSWSRLAEINQIHLDLINL